MPPIRQAKILMRTLKTLLMRNRALGGARPKATIRDAHGGLYICKLPKNDEVGEGICAWRYAVRSVARKAGISETSVAAYESCFESAARDLSACAR